MEREEAGTLDSVLELFLVTQPEVDDTDSFFECVIAVIAVCAYIELYNLIVHFLLCQFLVRA